MRPSRGALHAQSRRDASLQSPARLHNDSLQRLWDNGKRGFTQYQFVVPVEGARLTIRKILEEIGTGGCKPFLNVLKKFGKGTDYLSFPAPGYTFAIDFPISRKLFPFLKRLDALVLDAGGRIYAGKDATLDAQSFASMYSQLEDWKKIKRKYDPQNMFQSDIGRRLGLV